MRISIETTSQLERRLTISVPSEQFETQITGKLTEATKGIKLPGFRPGKVPLKEVRRRFGRGVRAEVASELMQTTFMEAIDQESLSPAGSPSLEVVKMEPGIDFEFTATFEVIPTIELKPFDQLNLQRVSAEITEQDIDNMVERLRTQRQTFEPVDRAAAEGDQVTVDYTGTIDGEPFDGGAGEDVQFIVGGGQMLPDFDAGVRDSAAGDTVLFETTFPDDYHAEAVRGKTAEFDLTMKTVAESKQPELDETFFESFGVKAEEGETPSDTMGRFRVEVADNMTREVQAAVGNALKRQVMERLADLHDVALPETMVHAEIHSLKQRMEQQLRAYAPNQDVPELDHDIFRDEANQRVKVGLIVRQIIASREISPDPDRVRQHIEAEAARYPNPQEVVNYYYANEEQLSQVESTVLESQVVDLIVNDATVEEVISNYEDVVSGSAFGTTGEPNSETAADTETEQDETP